MFNFVYTLSVIHIDKNNVNSKKKRKNTSSILKVATTFILKARLVRNNINLEILKFRFRIGYFGNFILVLISDFIVSCYLFFYVLMDKCSYQLNN